MLSRVIVGARDILTVAPLATMVSTVVGTILGLAMGYFGGSFDEVISRLVDALFALPTMVVALLALTALGASIYTSSSSSGSPSRRSSPAPSAPASSPSAGSIMWSPPNCGANASPHIMFVEVLPNVLPADPGRGDGAARLLDLHGRDAQLHRLRHPAALARLGFVDCRDSGLIGGGFWWTVLFDGVSIASLVVGVNLVADSIQGAMINA